MPQGLEIREATQADAPALAALLGELGYPVQAHAVPARLERFTTESHGRVLVAVASGVVVGFVAAEVHYPIHQAEPLVYVVALAVAAGRQRQGVGGRLAAAVEDFARARGCSRLVVTSAEPRASAHAFYLAHGWSYTGRRFGKTVAPSSR